ncbi:MAG: response regulator [Planctomycetota bacterium]|jgi:two-component system chemotaxis response regulator CheY
MSLNVLIVDDSAVTRQMIAKTLQISRLPLGEVHHAGHGGEALEVLENHWVDLAFVDINMPVMNGEELLERIRANDAWSDLAVVVVSTEGSETRIGKLTDLGARFVHKPFTPEQLRDVVTDMLGVHDDQNV